MSDTRDITKIVIDERFRKVPGDIESLARSIKEIGLLHPIVISYEDRLIAGWRRLEACKKLGWNRVPVTIVPLKDLAKGEFHENFVRKGFTISEMVAIKRALEPELKIGQGKRSDLTSAESAEVGKETREVLASYVGVSHDTLSKAETLVDAAETDPERFGSILASVDNGDTSLNYAYSMVKRAELQKIASPSLPEGQFDVIYADPPWKHKTEDGGFSSMLRGTPEHHYPTLDVDQLSSLAIPSAENAVLFLWVAPAFLRESLEIMESWGFSYRNQMVWVKNRFGTGYYFRIQHELLLLGIKGDIPAPLEHDRPPSILQSPMREHSQKPDEVYAIIEQMYPRRKYLELFARQKRKSWVSWGNQISTEN